MSNEPFKDILSESEIETLIKLQEKIQSKLAEKVDHAPPDFDPSSPYAFDEINKPDHLSNENRELIFYVRAEVSTIDQEKNQYLSLNQCLDESFHIPVPSGVNLENKINEFMSVFESSLQNLAQKIYNKQDG